MDRREMLGKIVELYGVPRILSNNSYTFTAKFGEQIIYIDWFYNSVSIKNNITLEMSHYDECGSIDSMYEHIIFHFANL